VPDEIDRYLDGRESLIIWDRMHKAEGDVTDRIDAWIETDEPVRRLAAEIMYERVFFIAGDDGAPPGIEADLACLAERVPVETYPGLSDAPRVFAYAEEHNELYARYLEAEQGECAD